jgi:acyl-coenzyme A synthetase/AMP-(fatty) acid ligase
MNLFLLFFTSSLITRIFDHDAVQSPGVGVFLDYWKNEEANRDVFRNGYYYTLDKAYRFVLAT